MPSLSYLSGHNNLVPNSPRFHPLAKPIFRLPALAARRGSVNTSTPQRRYALVVGGIDEVATSVVVRIEVLERRFFVARPNKGPVAAKTHGANRDGRDIYARLRREPAVAAQVSRRIWSRSEGHVSWLDALHYGARGIHDLTCVCIICSNGPETHPPPSDACC